MEKKKVEAKRHHKQHRHGLRSLGHHFLPRWKSLPNRVRRQGRRQQRAMVGLAADGRQIVARAKSEATGYERVYGEPIAVKELVECVAGYVHLWTHYWWLRPFGHGVFLGGYDRDGLQLYMIEPSGVSYRYFGAAIGKGRQAAKTFNF